MSASEPGIAVITGAGRGIGRALAHGFATAGYRVAAADVDAEADHARWRTEDLVPYIEHVIRWFGWSRVLFGSDWPVCLLAGTYERWLDVVTTALGDATAQQKRALFTDNARQVYRLDRAL